MVDSMIERAARALCRHDGLPENTMHGGKPMWMDFVQEAFVVFEAVGEPSDLVIKAARPNFGNLTVGTKVNIPVEPAEAWRKMVAAILSEKVQ